MSCFDLREFARDKCQRFLPRGFPKSVALANERLGQPVRTVDILPAKLALDAGRDSVGRAVRRLDLENMALARELLRPYIEAATDAAICAYRFRLPGAALAHLRLDFGELKDRSIAKLRLDSFHNV